MANTHIAIGILLALVTAAGCSHVGGEKHLDRASGPPAVLEQQGEPAAPSGGTSAVGPLIARGVEVYRNQYCGTCHLLDRAGTGGTFGPSHNGFATIAAQRIQADDYTGQATTAAEYISESILAPKVYFVPGYEATRFQMPAYSNLTPEDLEALVQLLLSEE